MVHGAARFIKLMTRYIIANASTAPKSKKGKRARKQKATMKLAPSGSGLSFSRTPVRAHEIISPRFRTNLMFEFVGNTEGVGSAQAIEFELAGNAVYLPGSVATMNSFEATGTAPACNGVTNGSGLTLTNAAGFANCIKLYNAYRVYASKINIMSRPLNAGSEMAPVSQTYRMIVTPFVGFSAAVVRASPESALVQPFGKETIVSNVNTNRYNTISHSMSTATIYGVNPNAVRDEDDFAAISGLIPPASNLWGWAVWFEPVDGSQPQVVVSVKVFYDIEFFNKNAITEGNS